MPTEDDVINETGLKIGGWLLYSPENDTYSRAGDTLYIDGRTEYVLTCYLVQEDCDAAMPFRRTNSGDTISDPKVYIPATETEGASLGEALTLDGDFNYSKEYKIGDKYGKRLTYSGTLENTYFRFFSSDPNKEYVIPREGGWYRVNYTLQNFSDEEITLQLSQIPGTNRYFDADGGKTSEFVTLKAGETVDISLENFLENDPWNTAGNLQQRHFITGVVITNAVSKMDLGFAMSYKTIESPDDPDPEPSFENFDITFGNDLVTYNGANKVTVDSEDFAYPVNSDLTLSSKVTGGKTIAGWYYYSDGNKVKVNDLASLEATSAMTVYPYFTTETGYTNVFFGSGKNGSIPNSSGSNFAAKPDGLNDNWLKARFSPTDNATVVNGKDNVAMIGSTIKYTQQASGEELKSGDYFRYDTKVAPLPNVEIGKTYSYIYNFENFGEERVSFTLQQINNGIDPESSTDNKITVTLDPGTSGTARLNNVTVNKTYNNAPNGNTLSLITIQSESLSSLNLGISLSMKEGQDETPAITEIDTTTPSVNYPTVTIGNSNLLTSTSGFSFELDGETTLPGNDAFSVNTDLTDGRTLAGWYYDDASGRHTLENLSSLQNSETDVTVYPYFGNVPGYNQLDLCNEQEDRKPANYFFAANPNPDEKHKEYVDAHFSPIKLGTLVNGTDGVAEIGSRIACDTQIVKGDYFRLNSTGPHPKDDPTNDVLSGHTYSFIFNLENFGDERISLQINQINSGVDLTSTTNNQAIVTLDPGCSGTIRLNVTYKGNNKNLLTFITVLSDSIDNLNLGMSAHYKDGAADKVVNQLEVLNS